MVRTVVAAAACLAAGVVGAGAAWQPWATAVESAPARGGAVAMPARVAPAVTPHLSSIPRGVPAPTTVAGYRTMFASVDPREWGAADVSLSVPMPDGRAVWLYGDTLSTRNGFVHSTAIVQSGGTLHVSHGGAQLLPDDAHDRIYWIEQGRASGSAGLIVTAAPMVIGTHGAWDFRRATAWSRQALLSVDARGEVTFVRWLGRVAAPPPHQDFRVLGPHHVAYGVERHPEARLSDGSVLVTTCQNWDDPIERHMVGGRMRWSDFRPLVSSG